MGSDSRAPVFEMNGKGKTANQKKSAFSWFLKFCREGAKHCALRFITFSARLVPAVFAAWQVDISHTGV